MKRLGIIGAGGYGRVHVDGFLALQAEGLVEIAALADTSAEVLDALRELPVLRNARQFNDYRDLLALPELDAVVINAPIPLHREITLAALERGLFILLEKPPVPLLSELDELIAADREGRVMVAFQHIYSRLIHDLKPHLAASRFGGFLSFSAHGIWPRSTAYYERAGWAGQLAWQGRAVLDGPCTNAFAHYINIILYLAGADPDGFAGVAGLTGETYRARPGLPTYDTGCLAGVLHGGIPFSAGFSHASSTESPVEIRVHAGNETFLLTDNCETLRSPDGTIKRGSDGRENMRRSFLAFAEGDPASNRTPLSATKPYVLATNLMFLSSGGIHPVPAESVRVAGSGSDAIFEIEDIGRVFQQCADQLVLPSATGAPWAKKGRMLVPRAFSEAELARLLQLPLH